MAFMTRVPGGYDLRDASELAVQLLGWPANAWLSPGFLVAHLHPGDVLSDDCVVRLARADGRWLWVHVMFEGERGVLLDASASRREKAMGRLASGIAHELNTPVQFASDNLGFVRDAMEDLLPLLEQYQALHETVAKGGKPGAAQLATLKEAEADADVQFLRDELPSAVSEAKKGLDRISAMVKAVKEYAPTDDVHGVDINRALENALVFAKHEYKYVADVETRFGQLPLVLTHVGELHQALLDLVLDAAQAAKSVQPRARLQAETRVEGKNVVIQLGAQVLRLPV